MTQTIPWTTGDGSLTLTYPGQGDGSIVCESVVNEGVDRSLTLTVSNSYSQSVTVTVSQLGRRQPFSGSDGIIYLAGGGQFLVLKSS